MAVFTLEDALSVWTGGGGGGGDGEGLVQTDNASLV